MTENNEGGTWIVENGVRRLLEAPTRDNPEGNRPRPADDQAQTAAPAPTAKTRKGASQ